MIPWVNSCSADFPPSAPGGVSATDQSVTALLADLIVDDGQTGSAGQRHRVGAAREIIGIAKVFLRDVGTAFFVHILTELQDSDDLIVGEVPFAIGKNAATNTRNKGLEL